MTKTTYEALFGLHMAVGELNEFSARDHAHLRNKYPKIMAELDAAMAVALTELRKYMLKPTKKRRA